MEVLFDGAVYDPRELCGIRERVRDTLRRAATGAAPDRRVDDQHEASVLVVMGELLTNAMRHGAPPYWLTVALEDQDTKVVVHDTSADVPVRRDPVPGEIGGFGLNVVAQIARTWGSATYEGGKRVWAAIPHDALGYLSPSPLAF